MTTIHIIEYHQDRMEAPIAHQYHLLPYQSPKRNIPNGDSKPHLNPIPRISIVRPWRIQVVIIPVI